ncbi:MAG: rod shape-determining protein RodA [Muribaculaceae bacterium]
MESRSTNTSVFRNLDWITVMLYAILVVSGAISIYAASYDFDHANMFDLSEFSGKQFAWIGLSFVLGFSLLLIEKRMYEAYAYPIYAILIFFLILTIFIAPDIKGSRSWIVLGSMSIQTAEFAKFATALALAKLFSSYNFTLNKSPKNYLRAIFIIFLPISLILLQKETGSALVYTSLIFVLYREGMSGLILFAGFCAIVFFVIAVKFSETIIMGITLGEFSVFIMIMILMVGMLFIYCKSFILGRNISIAFIACGIIAGILAIFGIEINGLIFFLVTILGATIYILISMFLENIRKILITVSFIIASIIFLFSVNYVFSNILEPHQQLRIKVTLGIEQDLRGAGYNVNQSKIAIGSGGFLGKGFLNGTQTKLKYVPEQHTDFIFCTIGEERGFVGSVAVLLIFLTLILRIIVIAERQHTAFGRVYAYCVVSYLIFHLSINIGMVIGISPVIGIPLPFLSYGGSALWGFTFLLFILLRIDASRKERSNY